MRPQGLIPPYLEGINPAALTGALKITLQAAALPTGRNFGRITQKEKIKKVYGGILAGILLKGPAREWTFLSMFSWKFEIFCDQLQLDLHT